jgi:hypothetical protein
LPSRPERPGIADRPDRPGDGHRPPIHTGDRVIAGNIDNINVNQWNQYNRNIAATHPVWRRPAYWNKPWYANRPAWYWGRPWYNRHWMWHHGYWRYWQVPPVAWLGVATTIGWLSTPGDTVVYNNVYYSEPAATPIYDYAQPIPQPSAAQQAAAFPPPPDDAALDAGEGLPTAAPPAPEPDDAAKKATKLFDEAREAFKSGKYGEAQSLAGQAIKELPSDATLHEFRALTLFAQGKYQESAAGLYAVLAAGPGWDWDTMKFLYPTENAYTEHLRALEEFVKANPKEGYAHFLLAYHYLVIGSKDSAVKELEQVVRLQPEDKLAAALVKALTTKEVKE